jgi:hypothetical protein
MNTGHMTALQREAYGRPWAATQLAQAQPPSFTDLGGGFVAGLSLNK